MSSTLGCGNETFIAQPIKLYKCKIVRANEPWLLKQMMLINFINEIIFVYQIYNHYLWKTAMIKSHGMI